MGALKGAIAVRRYTVPDALPRDARARFTRGLRAHAFMPLDPRSEVDRSAGWVSILDGEDADLAPEKLFFVAAGGEQLRASLRSDVLKAPASEVRRQVAARAAQMEADESRPLSRREKRLLKEEVTRALKLRAFPRVKIVDFVWDLDAKRVYFWSQAKGHNETFVDLFGKSFGLRIEVEGPARFALASPDAKRVAALEPTRELWLGFSGVRPLATAAGEEEEG